MAKNYSFFKKAIGGIGQELVKKATEGSYGVWQLAASVQALTIIVLAGLLYYTYAHKGVPEAEAMPIAPEMEPVTVEAAKVEVGTFDDFVSIPGTLKANESVVLRPEVDGKVRDLYFTSGQHVSKGDKIMKIEDAAYKAQLEEAQARLELSRSKYERALALLQRQAGTVKDKDESYAGWQIAKAEVDKASSQLRKTTITAPFDGVLGLRNLSVGAYIKPGDEIVTISDVETLRAEFSVSETHLDKITKDKEVTMEVEGFPDNIFRAKIEDIDANVDPLTHTLKVRATFSNVNGELKPGLLAQIRLLISSHPDAVMVPDSALEQYGNHEFVHIVKNGKAIIAPVKAGGRNGKQIEILSGLNPDDIVVLTGMKLGAGSDIPVRVVAPGALGGRQ